MTTPTPPRSSSRILTRCLALAGTLIAGAAAPAWSQHETPRDAAAQSVLLLRNGQVLHGRMTQAGDYWVVSVPEGEIRVRALEVDARCASLEEAYLRLRAAAGIGGVHDHLRLAQWCLREKLLDHAERELGEARALDASHPMLAMLQRRLEVAREPRVLDQSGKAAPMEVTAEDLDRMIRGLSPQAVESFTQRVQPLLVNNCTASGCHGPQSETGFRLLRVPADQPPSRRLTQRNLHAALQWINRDDPANSKLLTVPLHPHGTAKAAIFTDQQTLAYSRVLEWALQTSRRNGNDASSGAERVATTPFGAGGDAPSGFTPAAAVRAGQGGVVPTGYNAPLATGSTSSRRHYVPKSASSAARGTAGPEKAKPLPVEPEDEPAAARPASALRQPGGEGSDPFDPEVFNRRSAKP